MDIILRKSSNGSQMRVHLTCEFAWNEYKTTERIFYYTMNPPLENRTLFCHPSHY